MTTAAPAIGGIAPWFGAKRTIAPMIVAELGEARAYWEPFCGSLAVLMAKEPSTMETANDRHGDLINLARCLADESCAVDLYGRASRTLICDGLYEEAVARWRDRGIPPAPPEPDVVRAYDFLLTSWLGRNGVVGTKSYKQGFCVRYTQSGGHAATRWTSAVESIPAWHHRLRNVTILNRDAFAVLARIEDAESTAIYVDPPYVVKGASYVHDFDPDDHARLRDSLGRFTRSRVVVSYYDHPVIRDLYGSWTWVSRAVTRSLRNSRPDAQPGEPKAVEVLLVNGPSLTGGGGLFR